MVLQFGTLVVVSRRLSQHEVGIYYELFGLVTTTYFAAGLGLPDGLVKAVAHARAVGERTGIRESILRAGVLSLFLTISLGAICVAVFWSRMPIHFVLLTSGWWAAYGILFFCSQVLVALGHTEWGAFFFYPSSSIGLFITSVPYLLSTPYPNIKGTLWWTLVGAVLCAAGSLVCMGVYLRRLTAEGKAGPLGPVFRLGFAICISRVLQTALYWIPVWGVGYWQGAGAGASMGTASRLNVAVAALMAAIRFTIRPQIVKNAALGNWSQIASQSRKIATMASCAALVAIAGTLVAGHWMIGLVFGSAYASSSVLVAILLIGTLGECVGGPVDEILKMSGKAGAVSCALVIACLVEATLIACLARFGAPAAAACQATVFVGMYIYLLWLVWRRNRVYVGASTDWLHHRLSVGMAK
jgi:O-antigen/teichoic acid export membrane protein